MLISTTENNSFSGNHGQSILDSALNNNLNFEYSCRTGRCGVCKTTLLKGEVVELRSQLSISDEEKQNNKILTCCCAPKTDILIDAENLAALCDIRIKTLPARIDSINHHTSDIVEVTLRLPPTADFRFLEGQHLDVIHNNVRRSYSIASTSNDEKITLLIKRIENGVLSDYWFGQSQVNDLLRVEGPKGTFFLRDHSRPLMFLATGTGIAPIMSILNSLDLNPAYQQDESIAVFWGNRHVENFVWTPKFRNLNVTFTKVCSKPTDKWVGEVGYIQDIVIEKQSNILDFFVYACGSSRMIKSSKKALTQFGLPEQHFYSDAFLQSN